MTMTTYNVMVKTSRTAPWQKGELIISEPWNKGFRAMPGEVRLYLPNEVYEDGVKTPFYVDTFWGPAPSVEEALCFFSDFIWDMKLC